MIDAAIVLVRPDHKRLRGRVGYEAMELADAALLARLATLGLRHGHGGRDEIGLELGCASRAELDWAAGEAVDAARAWPFPGGDGPTTLGTWAGVAVGGSRSDRVRRASVAAAVAMCLDRRVEYWRPGYGNDRTVVDRVGCSEFLASVAASRRRAGVRQET